MQTFMKIKLKRNNKTNVISHFFDRESTSFIWNIIEIIPATKPIKPPKIMAVIALSMKKQNSFHDWSWFLICSICMIVNICRKFKDCMTLKISDCSSNISSALSLAKSSFFISMDLISSSIHVTAKSIASISSKLFVFRTGVAWILIEKIPKSWNHSETMENPELFWTFFIVLEYFNF